MQSITVPQLWGTNNPWASLTIIGTLESFEKMLSPLVESQDAQTIEQGKVEADKSLRRVANSLRALETRVLEAGERSENLHEKIELINQAHEAADQLPTDLKELGEKRESVAKLLRESITDRKAVDDRLGEITGIRAQLENKDKEATAVLERCEAAYRATTSQGLASAFAERSKKLGISMWIWVSGLIVALLVGAHNGSTQLHELAKVITDSASQTNRQNSSIWAELILTVLSIGAPVWFAWVATKQIGQRFRLAEDYGYKASIAKAYEGYRREAELLDPAFQHKLFSSALTRLDEIPLRLVEADTHGSPWHELASSSVVRNAMDTVPDFMGKITELAKQMVQSTKENKANDSNSASVK